MMDPATVATAASALGTAERLAQSQFALLLFTWLILFVVGWILYRMWLAKEAMTAERISALKTSIEACSASHTTCQAQNAALVQTMQKMMDGKIHEARGALGALSTSFGFPQA